MKIAVEGCCHGQLDAIYASIASLENQNGYRVSLLLICGDFQAIRNEGDLACMSVPDKYKELGEFWKYYTGDKVAPILTIIIGGNHEASNYFWELFHGGWIAPNMYFLGHAGCVQVNGIRIAGASGIFNDRDFERGFWERVPYNHGSMRSIYHIREYNIRRLSLLTPAPTIFLSHDWPQNIVHYGDLPRLLRTKPFFRGDVESGKLGSPPMRDLLGNLKPGWWFSAHLHVRFQAKVAWEGDANAEPAQGSTTQRSVKEVVANPDEIQINDIDGDEEVPTDAIANDTGEQAVPSGTAGNPDEIATDDDAFDDSGRAPPSTVAQSSPPTASFDISTMSVNPEEIQLGTFDRHDVIGEEQEVIAFIEAAPATVPDLSGVQQATSASAVATAKEWGDGKGWPETKFLALDKCLPRRQFLEILDIPDEISEISSHSRDLHGPPVLTFDPEWLAITRAFNPYMSTSRYQLRYPDEAEARSAVSKELQWVGENILVDSGEVQSLDMRVKRVDECQTFVMTAPGPQSPGKKVSRGQPRHYPNPQTAAFCTMLGIENKIDR
ncbi:lariat debranching enzyme, C-terminal domain-containing protein [Cytidiella melzeri]|nr:lariat debranching enzyme, C-terminal domain-containing protein [Cytidiella melzeri]